MKSLIRTYNINIVLALAFITFFSSSCNDWIDIEPENDLIQQEFWKTKDDVMAVVAATYNSLRETTEPSFYQGEIRADYLTMPGNGISDNNITPFDWDVRWDYYYSTINLANTVMHYAPIVQGSDQTLTNEILNELKAEMLFIRSLNYFYLARIWKEVPLVLSATISDTVNFYLPKSSEPAILNRLISDLKDAEELAGTKFSDYGRANKYAIQALLADIYLWKEDYNNCTEYCNKIINSGRFSLETNDNWFNLYYPGHSYNESIFEILYDDLLEGQGSPMIRITNNVTLNISLYGYDDDTDIRYHNGQGPKWKYQGIDELGSKRRKSGERDAGFIYYRYAEILLMKAECLAETGQWEAANALVKQIAERAGTAYTPSNSISVFRTNLLKERGREFAGEGKRWFEILRFAKRNNYEDQQLVKDILLGKAENAQELAIMRGKVIDTMGYYLPIHIDEIRVNKNLVQNPFYDR